jgi:two-component system, cell cycle sensor histidine kinase and response regulator CckA
MDVTEPSIQHIKSRSQLIVGLILCAVIGISVWSILSERSATISAAEKMAQGYSRALAEHTDSAFSEADGMMRMLLKEIRESGGLERVDRNELLRKMRLQTANAPQLGVMFVVDGNGTMRLNTSETPFKELSVADRDYFRNYLNTPGLQLSFGKPLVSRLTKRLRMNMMRPLNEPGAPFAGLLAAGFDTDFFDHFFSPDTLGPRGRVVLIRDDGVPLVSSPYRPDAYRIDFRQSTLFRERLPTSPAGVYHVKNRLTFGEPYIVSYQRLARFPAIALITLNEDDVLAPWVNKAIIQSSLTLGLCVVIVILMRLIFSHLQRLRLAQGVVSDQQVQLGIKAAQIDAANDAILQIDPDGRLVHFNQALCKLTGYDAAELSHLRLQDILPPEFADKFPARVGLIRERQQATFESSYLAKDGALVPVEVQARMMESQGRSMILSIARDITQRKRADLRELAQRRILEQIANGAPLEELLAHIVRFVEQQLPGALCSVLLADETGVRLRHGAAPSLPDEYNRAVDGLLVAKGMGSCGTAAFLRQRVVVEDIEVHPYWKGFQPARRAGLRACWSEPVFSSREELLGTLAIYSREPRLPRDEEIELIVSAAHLASIAIGRVRGDESRRLLEEQLRQIQKIEAVGQLAAGIAHDFNNLLTPICVYSDLVRHGLPDNHPQIKQMDTVIQAARKASELTRKLLTFGRKQVLCMEVLDLNEVIVAFQDIMRTTVRESVAIDLRLPPGHTRVLADRVQLEQILLNLAVNAQDAINGTGAICVETGRLVLDDEYVLQHPGIKSGPYALLAFTDNGCGMDAETLRHIYEPFFTTKEVGHGTGLGLATVYGIVKQHEGYIEVWSEPGQGTTFKIFLPLSQRVAEQPFTPASSPAAKPAGGAGRTILLVEDNAMIREMAEELLAGDGYRTLVAATPTAALDLAALHGGRIDMLVTDVVMPHMNGPELYEMLLQSRPELPVLYISGYTGNVVLHKETLDPKSNFLSKPFTLEQFLERVELLLSA